MQGVWNTLTYGKHRCAITHIKDQDAQDSLSCVINHAIQIKDSIESTNSLPISNKEQLISGLKGKHHAHLILASADVIIKKSTHTNTESKTIVHQVNQTFPNLNLEEFYYQVFDYSSVSYIAIVRKEYTERIINFYEALGINIINLSLGFSSILPILSLLRINDIVLRAQPYEIHFIGNQPDNYSHNPSIPTEYYQIDSENIKSDELLNIGALAGYLGSSSFSNLTTLIHRLERNIQQKKILKLGIPIGFGLIFIILLMNAMIFSTYYSKLEDIRINQQQELSKFRQSQVLQREIDSIREDLTQIQPDFNNNPSQLINKIIAEIPEEIQISRLAYQPLEKQIAPDKPLDFVTNTILLQGSTIDQVAITRLIHTLESFSTIKEVTLNNLQLNKDNYEFTINIKLD